MKKKMKKKMKWLWKTANKENKLKINNIKQYSLCVICNYKQIVLFIPT